MFCTSRGDCRKLINQAEIINNLRLQHRKLAAYLNPSTRMFKTDIRLTFSDDEDMRNELAKALLSDTLSRTRPPKLIQAKFLLLSAH
jgi:hypothetical protein